MMNRILKTIGILAFILSAGCKFIPPGHVGVKVNLFGTNRGVQDTTIVTGRVWYNPYTKAIYEFPTFMQYKIWTKSPNEGSSNDESITFVSKDKIQVNVDVSAAYMFEADKVPELFVTFRQPPDVIADTYIRSRVRDAFVREGSSETAMDILGGGIGPLDASVLKTVDDEMKTIGIHFDYISIVGKPRIPDAIQDAINQAIESTQRAAQAQNQVAVKTAEANQAVATAVGKANSIKTEAQGTADAILLKAQAEAKANQLVAASLTPELVAYKRVLQWDGHVPQYMLGNGVVPFLDLSSNPQGK